MSIARVPRPATSQAEVRAAQAALLELERGTRCEQIAQGKSAVALRRRRRPRSEAVSLEKLDLVAPRAGVVDSLPYRLGDQAPVGRAARDDAGR